MIEVTPEQWQMIREGGSLVLVIIATVRLWFVLMEYIAHLKSDIETWKRLYEDLRKEPRVAAPRVIQMRQREGGKQPSDTQPIYYETVIPDDEQGTSN